MKTINIDSINFDNIEDKNKTKNYPNLGFFLANVENGFCDLVFIDKNNINPIYICPEENFNNIFKDIKACDFIEKLNPTNELIQESIKYDGDFILEFSRILLNRK